MPKRKEYIPSPEHWKEMFLRKELNRMFTAEDKVPIKQIKFDQRLLAYPNKVNLWDVEYMVANFDQEVWMPITVNRDYYLIDGQHRLSAAKQMRLKYIDVVMQHHGFYVRENGK